MHRTALVFLTLSLALTGCLQDGVDGADGADGTDGADGAAGADGADGSEGAAGGDGDDGLCADATPIEISGLEGLPTEPLQAYYPSDAVQVLHNADPADLSFAVAGYGIDYTWTLDSFAMTASTDMPSAQVIIATDGCSTAVYEFEVEAALGLTELNFVNLYDDTSAVDFYLAGDSLPLFETLGMGSQSGYLGATAMPATIEAWADGKAIATSDELELMADLSYTLVLYSDAGVPSFMLLEDDLSATSDGTLTRLRPAHLADTIGQIDVWETATPSLVVEDLDFGVAGTAMELITGEYPIGIDTDDDTVTDYNFVMDLTDLGGVSLNAFVYTYSGLPFIFISAPDVDFYEALMVSELPGGTEVSTTSTPGAAIEDYATTTDVMTVGRCGLVLDVALTVDIDHTWPSDMDLTLVSPAGTSVLVSEVPYSSDDWVVGTFTTDGSGDLDSTLTGDLNDFLLETGTGDWTFEVYDGSSGDSGTLNTWTLDLTCF